MTALPAWSPRPVITDPVDAARAADQLAAGLVVAHGFANFYALTARGDADTVRRVNRMKGRPADQVGSITGPPAGLADVFDLTALPPGLSRRTVLDLMDAFFTLGPFGFRGPAAAAVPDHLTAPDSGVRTAQVIAPGYACPSNDLLSRAQRQTGDLLYITSANRSRHLTGAADSPAHWRASGLYAEFGDEPGLVVVEHGDEAAARARYSRHSPMSTTVLDLHRVVRVSDDPRPQLIMERHGSLPVEVVRDVLSDLGYGLVLGAGAQRRLVRRDYPAPGRGRGRHPG